MFSGTLNLTMNQTLKRLLAGAGGSLIGLSCAKYISSSHLSLALWAFLSGLIAFIMVSPGAFSAEAQMSFAEWLRKRRASRAAEQEELKSKNARRAAHKEIYGKLYEPHYRLERLHWLSAGVLLGWCLSAIALVCNSFLSSPLTWGQCVLAILLIFISSLVYARFDAGETQIEDKIKIDPSEINGYLLGLLREIPDKQETLVFMILLPVFMLKWMLWNVPKVLYSMAIILAKACLLVQNINRWMVALGAIAGYAVGFSFGKSELIAMSVGGLSGIALHWSAWMLLSILPKPSARFPSFAA